MPYLNKSQLIGLCYMAIFFCLFVGLLYPCLAIFGHDIYSKKNRTLSTIIRWRKREHDIWQTTFFYNLLQMVAPLVPLSEHTEKKMNDDLARADIPYNAKEYYAKAILSALGGVAIAVLAVSMDSTLLVIGGLLLALWLFFKNYDQLSDTLGNKMKLLEGEIPTFIRSIVSGLQTDRDIIRVIERYYKIASPAMKSELDVLLTDMQSSSVPQALLRFDNRMNSPDISRLVAALIEVERGIDSTLTLEYLANDMQTMHRQLIQRELDKRPGQMKRAIIPAAIILVISMFYMLVEAVIRSVQTMF